LIDFSEHLRQIWFSVVAGHLKCYFGTVGAIYIFLFEINIYVCARVILKWKTCKPATMVNLCRWWASQSQCSRAENPTAASQSYCSRDLVVIVSINKPVVRQVQFSKCTFCVIRTFSAWSIRSQSEIWRYVSCLLSYFIKMDAIWIPVTTLQCYFLDVVFHTLATAGKHYQLTLSFDW